MEDDDEEDQVDDDDEEEEGQEPLDTARGAARVIGMPGPVDGNKGRKEGKGGK